MTKPPNILFLMSDEHRADVAGFAGDKVVRTPTLDWLSETGVTFTNAYTPSPICIPARQSLMSGQFPRTHGCEYYGQDLAPGSMTFARRLAEYGYEAVVSGKLHHMGTDQMQGWTQRLSGDMKIDARYLGEAAGRYRRPMREYKWSDAKEIQRAGVGKGPVITHDEDAVTSALHFIERYFVDSYYDRDQTHPLLLKLSLMQPHYPYFTDEEKFNYYLNRVQPYVNEPVSEHPFLSGRQVRPGVDASERELRRATAAYYGMIETVDTLYAQVLQSLQNAGQNLDDWLIIYTSDHGEMLGQHGVWEKQKFYEGSVKVPLILRYPHRFAKGKRVEANVNLCDLFATLCEVTDTPAVEGLDSRSLVPLIEGADDLCWNNETVSQFGGRNLMIKQGDLKYQYYGEDMPEVLFDLASNPEETINYMQDPSYREAIEQFRKRRDELSFGPHL